MNLEPRIVTEGPRAQARRRQVLEAAARCFRRHGFHACSMMQISAEAQMSVGHIYRYFTSKEAIISAIVRENVDEILCWAANFPKDAKDLRAALTERANEWMKLSSGPENAALTIEIRAEAARNPATHELVKDCDKKSSAQLDAIISAALGRRLMKADLDARVEMFQLILYGISLRSVISPHIDRRALSQIVELTIDAILR